MSSQDQKETLMRISAILVVLFAVCATGNTALAQQSDDCKLCGEQLRACVKNHSQAACKTEFDICMKHCRRK